MEELNIAFHNLAETHNKGITLKDIHYKVIRADKYSIYGKRVCLVFFIENLYFMILGSLSLLVSLKIAEIIKYSSTLSLVEIYFANLWLGIFFDVTTREIKQKQKKT